MENWRNVEGYSGYQVSDLGRVKGKFDRVLKPRIDHNGYARVVLYGAAKPRSTLIHRIVCTAFIGPRPDGHEVNHINGIRHDNRLANLDWVTRSENQLHRRALGTAGIGEANGNAKLKEGQVLQIRQRKAAGESSKNLAFEYKVSTPLINKIVARECWRNI